VSEKPQEKEEYVQLGRVCHVRVDESRQGRREGGREGGRRMIDCRKMRVVDTNVESFFSYLCVCVCVPVERDL